MIILEFLVFVITSGLFCSEKFRHHIWAVLVAGAIATGSSLLFAYDLGMKLAGHEKEPPVITKIVKQTVVKTVKPSQAASAVTPHNCASSYPPDALSRGEQGVTLLGFKIMTDGTVDAIKVLSSSGSERLDEAAMRCASGWHYRPAIKDGQLVETSTRASVKWTLSSGEAAKQETASEPEPEKATEEAAPASEVASEKHAWYDVLGWFSSESEKPEDKSEKPADKKPQAP